MDSGEQRDIPGRQVRNKYVTRACQACKQRKTKCSGHDTCLSCQDRGLSCVYNLERRRRKMSTTNIQRRRREQIVIDPDDSRTSISSGRHSTTASLSESFPEFRVEQVSGSLQRQTQSFRPDLNAPLKGRSLYRSTGLTRNSISLRSQIEKTRASFRTVEEPDSAWSLNLCDSVQTYSFQLPSLPEISSSLRNYFQSINLDYPALDRASTKTRILRTLEGLGYPSYRTKIEVDLVTAPTVALLCAILAIDEIVLTKTSISATSRRESIYRNHVQKLLEKFELLPVDVEIVRCHLVNTIYLLHVELLDLAIQSSAVTVRLAMLLQLHRSSPQIAEHDHGKKEGHKYLWNTIYVIDQTVARLSGTSYLIRDEHICDSTENINGCVPRYSHVISRSRLCQNTQPDQLNESRTPEDLEYLEAMTHLGRLWTSIWDQLFSNPDTSCHWQEAEMVDTLIQIYSKELPPTLVWRMEGLPQEHKHTVRRKLLILMTMNSLRLIIRLNPASECPCHNKHEKCGIEIAADTIETISNFHKHHITVQGVGLHISTTLVQCVLYLVKVIGESPSAEETEYASSYVESAYEILVDMAKHCTQAISAVEALDYALSTHTDISNNPTYNTFTPQHSRSLLTGQNDSREIVGENRSQTPEKQDNGTGNKSDRQKRDFLAQLQQGYRDLDLLSPEKS